MKSKLLTVIVVGIAAAGFATAASAVGTGVGIKASVGGGAQAVTAEAGGNAGAQMSPSGSTNSNAQWQEGANKGADRAGERMSTTGAEKKHTPEAETEAASTATKGKRTGKR